LVNYWDKKDCVLIYFNALIFRQQPGRQNILKHPVASIQLIYSALPFSFLQFSVFILKSVQLDWKISLCKESESLVSCEQQPSGSSYTEPAVSNPSYLLTI